MGGRVVKEIEEFRDYLKNELRGYQSGQMMSMAESVHGKAVIWEVLRKFNELFTDEGE
jgi:hypothetical protein